LHRVSSFLSVLMLCLLLVVAHLLPCSGLLGATSLVHGGRAATRAQSSAASGNTLQSSSMNSLQSSSMNGVQSSSMNNMQASSQNNLQSSSMNNMQSSNMNSMQASNQNSLQLSSASSNTFQSNSANSLQVGTSTRFRAGVASKLSSYLEYGYTPEERMALHAEKYEKEFVIELNMTLAHETGESIGAQLNMDTDFTPVSVLKIRKNGLLEGWNQAHPEDQVLIGDEIIKVNDILWHHNSRTFAQRIGSQFKAARDYVDGAKRTLSLGIQRPRQVKEVRTQLQRDDLHRKLYSLDFAIDLTVKAKGTSSLGLVLNRTVDWVPIGISRIEPDSLVGQWNARHPEAKVMVGDEVVKINAIGWHHNSETFESRIKDQFAKARRDATESLWSNASNVTSVDITLAFQRPRWVQDSVDNLVFEREQVVQLRVLRTGANKSFGWKLNGSSAGVVIDSIEPDSVLSAWNDANEANPSKQIVATDRIIKLNSAPFFHKKYEKFMQTLDQVANSSQYAAEHLGYQPPMLLRVMRTSEIVYQRGWLARLDANQGLGWRLNSEQKTMPLTVNKIRSSGAVATWNQANPDDAIMPGDQVFKFNSGVRDELWDRDSPAFLKHLNREFTNAMSRNGSVYVWIQRPLEVEGAEDAAVDKQFAVDLPVGADSPIGWQLETSEDDNTPVSIGKIRRLGSVTTWNEDHPTDYIQTGDQLLKVDNLLWHNNTKVFMRKLVSLMRRSTQQNATIKVMLQRPKGQKSKDAFGEMVSNADGIGELGGGGEVIGTE